MIHMENKDLHVAIVFSDICGPNHKAVLIYLERAAKERMPGKEEGQVISSIHQVFSLTILKFILTVCLFILVIFFVFLPLITIFSFRFTHIHKRGNYSKSHFFHVTPL